MDAVTGLALPRAGPGVKSVNRMSLLSFLCLCLYFGLLGLLSIYGVHRTWLMWRLQRQHSRAAPDVPERALAGREAVADVLEPFGHAGAPERADAWVGPSIATAQAKVPRVTVQLPIYNEKFVVERLIDAACALDWPIDRLEVQVLDDSTDETVGLATARVAWHRRRGVDVVHLRRPDRTGFKAGALEHGLGLAKGELIAVFDADFVPGPDFLKRCVDAFRDPTVGMVQARWGHLNPDYSGLTRVQAALLDGHFLIEHASRHAAGHFFNFNGTAGIWRRDCIDAAGGWQHDTLTEDLDLSYRAQLRGWRFVYRPEVVAPAELPVEMTAFKSQQRRWAKGSIQTGIKLLPQILRSRLPWGIRIEAFFHLTANLCYVWMALIAVLLPAAVAVRGRVFSLSLLLIDVPLFVISLSSVARFYLEAQRGIEPSVLRRLVRLPALMAVGTGMALSNGIAVIEALCGIDTPFLRTPKHRIEGRGAPPAGYHSPAGWLPLIELAIAAWLLAGMGYAVTAGLWASLPFMSLFVAGYLYVGLASLAGMPWRTGSIRGAAATVIPASSSEP